MMFCKILYRNFSFNCVLVKTMTVIYKSLEDFKGLIGHCKSKDIYYGQKKKDKETNTGASEG